MNHLTRFSMKNMAALFIMMILLFGSGMYAANKLKVENMPNVSFPVVVVSTSYTGSPQDVMDQITDPLEKKLANIEDLDSMTSSSSDNSSRVILQFKQGTDTDKKKQDIESLLQEVSLPSGAGTPKASTFGASSMPSLYLVASAENGMSQTELDKRYDDTIKPALESLKGIDHVDSIGVRDTSLDIKLKAEALQQYGFTPSQVTAGIKAALTKSPIGSVEISGNDKMARVTGDLQSVYDLEQLELTTAKGDIVQLGQLAQVEAITESKFSARLTGKPAISMILFKTSSANAVDFSDDVEKLKVQWKKTLPGASFITTYDSADEIRESIQGMLREGVVGAVLASLMILVFLRNVRMTLIVLVSIPLSILITLLLMWQLGLTLNTMTLGGMFIAVGRVVDDSIVVIENIYTSLEKAHEKNESVILLATKQVAMAITSSTLATVGVFAPIGMVSGMVGGFFRPFAITLACALLSSLLVALTVIPMLSKLLVLRSRAKSGKPHDHETQGKWMGFYESALRWSLNHRLISLLLAAALFVGTLIATVPNLALSFLPSGKSSRTMYFVLKLPYETGFEATEAKTKELEQLLMAEKDSMGQSLFTYVEGLAGYNGNGDNRYAYAAQIYAEANEQVDPDKVKEQAKQFILSELPKGSEVEPKSIGGGPGVSTTDFSYRLMGDDQTTLEQAALIIKAKLQEFPELSEIEDSLSDGKTEVQITVDQKKARAYGLTATAVKETAGVWIQKQNLGDLKLDGLTYTTTVSMDKSDKDTLDKLGNIPLSAASGTTVYLKEVASVKLVDGPVSLSRTDQKQQVSVTAKINADNKNGVSARVVAALRGLELPDGVTTEVKGVSADINESFSQLFMAMGVAIFMIYLVMVLAFGNAGAPFAILFSLPLAAIGGLVGLIVTKEALNVTSMIGFMMLIGIVVTNAIVLIDRAQQLREEGYVVREALLEAGKIRMRPIIMTAGATIMALFPLALGLSGEGALIGKGLGVVVIGGLITSTILTLFVVPVVYELIEDFKAWVYRLFHRSGDDRNVKPHAGLDV
ncbi:efflux RND transporter permease subunit [Paenibacillus thalictri]|uniref:Efflux RND transporter permease subunit n=1 Tax=Paenibacillus thalictri TaxID=2527873 RepID=A0A4Q9DR30_9BACL|nr:efflux RND transporter permease subunit [Paenibacillus thalictri]TBL77872.1 efflux RND transporter permease subunit [Paenibacillus thalictri]